MTVEKKCTSGLDIEGCDFTADPREDFYQYCNGNWQEEIPSDRSSWGTFVAIREDTQAKVRKLVDEVAGQNDLDPSSVAGKVGILWRAAMDTDKIEADGLSSLDDVFKEINFVKNKFHFIEMTARLHTLGVRIMFGCHSGADMKNSEDTILYIGEGALGLGSREFYFDVDKAKKRAAYLKHVETMFTLANIENPKAAAAEVMSTEKLLAGAAFTDVEKRDVHLTYNPITRKELDSAWDWKTYFDVCVAGDNCLDITESEVINLTNPRHHKFVCSAVTDENVGAWKNYAKFHTLKRFAKYLPEAFVNEDFEFYSKYMTGQLEMGARWKRMLTFVENYAGELCGALYCDRYFPAESKAQMLELVENVIASLRTMIEGDIPWMSESTRKSALQKVDHMGIKIGYPDQYIDYSTFTPKPDDTFLSIVRQIFEFEHIHDWLKCNNPTDRDCWGMPPQMVNAMYSAQANEISFPAAILQGAAFNPDRDICVNYGAIGAVIGHELTHGFDDEGKAFDHVGNMVNWWTDEDTESYNALTKNIVDQYNAIEILPGHFVRGDLTLGENIADIGGLKCAYQGMRTALKSHPEADRVIDGWTPDQRFFVAWGQFWRSKSRKNATIQQIATDPHSPGQLRAYLPPMNLVEFINAFGIKEGHNMYIPPEKRGNVW